MSTTSGRCSRQAGTAAPPSPTAATTSMSSRSENSSSSASRKTALSSTRRIRTGAATARSLLGGEKQRIVRLPAVLHVDVQIGMRGGDALDECVERWRVEAGEEREQVARLGQQALRHGSGDVVEVGAARDRLPVGEAEPLALANGEAAELDVARRDRDLARRDGGDCVAHLGGVLG